MSGKELEIKVMEKDKVHLIAMQKYAEEEFSALKKIRVLMI